MTTTTTLPQTLLAKAIVAHPTLAPSAPALAQALKGRPGTALAEVRYAEDYVLAIACLMQVPQALEALDRLVVGHAAPAIMRVVKCAAQTDDLLQQLRARVFTADGKLQSYRGQGPLGGWLRAIAVRQALEFKESLNGRPPEELPEELPLVEDDVELRYLRLRHREAFKAAFKAAFSALSPRDRTVVRLNLADGISLERLGASYGVHKSTVSRWVAAARALLRDTLRSELCTRLGMDGRAVDSLLDAVGPNFSMSLPSLGEPSTLSATAG